MFSFLTIVVDFIHSNLSLRNYITLEDVVYHKGDTEDDALNYKSTGVRSFQDCYSLCLHRNGDECFSIRCEV